MIIEMWPCHTSSSSYTAHPRNTQPYWKLPFHPLSKPVSSKVKHILWPAAQLLASTYQEHACIARPWLAKVESPDDLDHVGFLNQLENCTFSQVYTHKSDKRRARNRTMPSNRRPPGSRQPSSVITRCRTARCLPSYSRIGSTPALPRPH